jgi:hypothetical protein
VIRDSTLCIISITGLPSSKSIEFDDGIIIDIKFDSICSNVCSVIIHVASFGKAHWCDANIYELSDVSFVLFFCFVCIYFFYYFVNAVRGRSVKISRT